MSPCERSPAEWYLLVIDPDLLYAVARTFAKGGDKNDVPSAVVLVNKISEIRRFSPSQKSTVQALSPP